MREREINIMVWEKVIKQIRAGVREGEGESEFEEEGGRVGEDEGDKYDLGENYQTDKGGGELGRERERV